MNDKHDAPLPFLNSSDAGTTVALKIQPNAPANSIQGIWEDRLRIKIKSPPVDGKANKALCRWIAKLLKIRASAVEILHGEKSTQKVVLLRDMPIEEVKARFRQLLDNSGAND